MDSRNDTGHAEELGGAAKERLVVRVETKAIMTKEPTQVEEITGSTAEVENLERPRAIQPEVLNAFYVDANPVPCVFISVDLPRIRPIRILRAQSF